MPEPARKLGLLERLGEGAVICAEGYLFEMERRGYLQAGAFVPEVVVEHPEVVAQLHREFMRAGSDVVEAFTYYAHREKLKLIGREGELEAINRQALRIAKEVAGEGDALVAGNVCNTNVFGPGDAASAREVRAMFEEQIGWAVDAGVDFIIGETFAFAGEAELALAAIRQSGLPSVITFAMHKNGLTREGFDAAEACARLEDAGADVVGMNCARGPDTMWPLLEEVRKRVKGHIAALPVPYRTHASEPTFQALVDPHHCAHPAGERSFPTALDPFTCTRYEIADFARRAADLGVRYLGVCCGAGPHHIRSMAEALGRRPAASRYSPDMSRHYSLGSHAALKEANREYARDL